MKLFLKTMALLAGLILSASATAAQLKVFACEPEWASLSQELGKDKVSVYSATVASQDPHRIEARPSLIAKLRRSHLLVCSGADLEAAWLPLLVRQASNRKVMPGQAGHFMASDHVTRLGQKSSVDRSQGDVHVKGNPHVHLDPHRLLQIAEKLSQRLIQLDPDNELDYQKNWTAFNTKWKQSIQRWENQAKSLKGERIVTLHDNWAYLFEWLEIVEAGTLEPKPGLPTTAAHMARLNKTLKTKPAKIVIHTAYQSPRLPKRLAASNGLTVVELPYTVGGTKDAKDLFSLFSSSIDLMLKAL